jgi:hypothetical protein
VTRKVRAASLRRRHCGGVTMAARAGRRPRRLISE